MLSRMGSFNVALLEALLSAGVSPERARAVVDLFDRSVDERHSLHAQVLATKRDVAELETRLARDMASMEGRLSREIAATKVEIASTKVEIAATHAEIASTKVEIAGMKVDLAKWFLGALTAQTALLLGAAKLF
jgi:multidrug resistance efflux pump